MANVWCTLALLPPLKLKSLLPVDKLLLLTTACTLGSLAPPCALPLPISLLTTYHLPLTTHFLLPSHLLLLLAADYVLLTARCVLLLLAPSRRGFLLCAVACGLGFFLLSFQVQDKLNPNPDS